jgi:hypothetical protein
MPAACNAQTVDLGNSRGASCGDAGDMPVVLATGQLRPTDIAVDGTSVYWTNTGGAPAGSIAKVPLCGGTPVTLANNVVGAAGIVVSSTDVLWAAYDGTINEVPIGGGATTMLATGAQGIVAIEADEVYWPIATGGCMPSPCTLSVLKMSLTGGTPSTLASMPFGSPTALTFAVDSDDVYWTNQMTGVFKVPVSGGAITTLSSVGAGGIAVDDTNVYWSVPSTASIMKMPKLGGTPTTLAAGLTGSDPLVVDSESVYWIDSVPGCTACEGESIVKVALDGGAPITLAKGQNNALALTVDSSSVYWVNAGTSDFTGTVMKVAK